MATEKRLIDANALDWWYKGRPIRRVIDEAPTIDAVEVVRCKDCKGRNSTIRRPEGRCLCERNSKWVFDDDFCSCGERKDNEEN